MTGNNYRGFEYLGAHNENGKFVFRVWAPAAEEVYVVGSFNSWTDTCPMKRIGDSGIWEACTDAAWGDMYKFRLKKNGMTFDKADPYAFSCEKPPATASVLFDIGKFEWHDERWLEFRSRTMSRESYYSQPINVYEIHAESWRKRPDSSFLSYDELAAELIPYVKQMGYTHIELMPIMEYPFSPSWGYQICGYFAPTSRLGNPSDFMSFIDTMHGAGVGVILDWVPAHFPKDAHGLYEFAGVPQYEYEGADRQEYNSWGTRKFNIECDEVAAFLISNAVFWAEMYHVDGIRVDAVSSMLYLNYDKGPGEWKPNKYGDNRYLEAMEFFKKLNRKMADSFPDVLMIAEESSPWPHVTGFDSDGLGFSLKWNMGWMHDSLDYTSLDPYFRKFNHNRLTFSLTYAFNEKFILPLSHDEVVYGKKSLIERVPGEYGQKFATLRTVAVFMMTHPGKKLNFMGNEIGQFKEWDYSGQIEWFLTGYESHARLQLFHSELNNFYLAHPELWEVDDSWAGFSWIDPDNGNDSVYSYRRIAKDGRELIVILNFTPVVRSGFVIGVPYSTAYTEVLNSDETKYGGSGMVNPGLLTPQKHGANWQPYSISLTLPPLGAVILQTEKRVEIKTGGKIRRRTVITPIKF